MEQPMIDTKTLFAPKKGKEATKGQKQIHEDNMKTINFYLYMALTPIIPKVFWTFLTSSSTGFNWLLLTFAIIVQSGSLGGMYYMAKPIIKGPSNTVVDGGIDLNLKAGFADYLKDIITTTAFCTGLSLFSNYFWILWLWLPAYFVYKIWVSFVAPWIFAPAPEEPTGEVADKKRRKMERKMARAGYR